MIKKAIFGLMFMGLAAPALALDKSDLENRIRMLTAKFEALQQNPRESIPAETLRKAKGIVLLDRTKAGFLFAYQGGAGIAMVKDESSGGWSPVSFVTASQASLGLQVGGQQSFLAILFMNTNALNSLVGPDYHFGGEARGTAGNSSAGVSGDVTSQQPSVVVFGDRQGLYGGVAVKGGSIAPDTAANVLYYGEGLSAQQVLFGDKVKPTETASALAREIEACSELARK
jgi:lipid-binding SYLF domain-containing protein